MTSDSRSDIVTTNNDEVDAGVATTNGVRSVPDQFDARQQDSSPVFASAQQCKRSSRDAAGTFAISIEDREGQVVTGRRCNRCGNLKTVVHHVAPRDVVPNRSTHLSVGNNPSRPRGMRPFSGNEGRYAAVDGGARRLWIRDQVTLQADVVDLLRREGSLPKKRIIVALSAALAAIDTALATLLDAQLVECYSARSQRGRMDEFWCIFGQSPVQPISFKFPAAETLAAMQTHATQLYGASK